MPHPFKSVFLLPKHMAIAEQGAAYRYRHNLTQYRGGSREEATSTRRRTEQEYSSDVMIGCLGELAWAVWQRRRWNPADQTQRRPGECKKADFDEDKEIRAAYAGAKFLLLQATDPDERIYILAYAMPGCNCVNFSGWEYGKIIKASVSLRDYAGRGAPCYWYPKKNLRNIFELPGLTFTEEDKRLV